MRPSLCLLFLVPAAAVASLGAETTQKDAPARRHVAEPPPDGRVDTRIYVEIPEQPLELYVERSDEIVRGIVTGRRAVFPDEGIPYTEYDLYVLSTAKGDASGMLAVRVGGAEDATRKVDVVGAPRFVDGEEVLLFLTRERDASGTEFRALRGLDHGTYRMPLLPQDGPSVIGLHAEGERDLAAFETRVAALRAHNQERK